MRKDSEANIPPGEIIDPVIQSASRSIADDSGNAPDPNAGGPEGRASYGPLDEPLHPGNRDCDPGDEDDGSGPPSAARSEFRYF